MTRDVLDLFSATTGRHCSDLTLDQLILDELEAVAVYAFVDEMTHEQIAEMLGCSRRHVGDLLERFREQARKLVLEAA